MNAIKGRFLNCLVLVGLLEQTVNWEVLPGEVVKPQDGNGMRGIHGQVCKQLLKTAGRDSPLLWSSENQILCPYLFWGVPLLCWAWEEQGTALGPCASGSLVAGDVPVPLWVSQGNISVPSSGQHHQAHAQPAKALGSSKASLSGWT